MHKKIHDTILDILVVIEIYQFLLLLLFVFNLISLSKIFL